MKNLATKIIYLVALLCFFTIGVHAQTANFTTDSGCVNVSNGVTNIDKVALVNHCYGCDGDDYSLVWNFGDGNTKTTTTDVDTVYYTYSSAGQYSVKVQIYYNDAVVASKSKLVKIFEAPSVTFNYSSDEDIVKCYGNDVFLEVNMDINDGILWSNQSTGTSLTITEVCDMTFGAVVYTDNLCSVEETVHVTINPTPVVELSESDGEISVDKNTTTSLSGVIIDQGDGASYTWSPATDLSSANVIDPDIIMTEDYRKYTISAQLGECSSTDKILIVNGTGSDLTEKDAPEGNNVIIPDSDNNYWTFDGVTDGVYANCSLYIYNRWGKEVYKKETIGTDLEVWNGRTTDNEELPSDAYYYLLKTSTGAVHKGAISILRK